MGKASGAAAILKGADFFNIPGRRVRHREESVAVKVLVDFGYISFGNPGKSLTVGIGTADHKSFFFLIEEEKSVRECPDNFDTRDQFLEECDGIGLQDYINEYTRQYQEQKES